MDQFVFAVAADLAGYARELDGKPNQDEHYHE